MWKSSILFVLFIWVPSLLIGQNRIGSISLHSSDVECRNYFKKNISKLDPIEGIYQREIFSKEVNNYRDFPMEKLESSKVCIYREGNGKFRVSKNTTIERIGETMFYNYIVNWGGKKVISRFSFDGMTFNVASEVPQREVNRNLSQTYINANTRLFFVFNCIKEYPTYSMYQENERQVIETHNEIKKWSGTGFALKDGYIATNYHVVENAQTINICGVNGNFTKRYNVSVIATDKYNDLALLRVTDTTFLGFGNIPYNVKTTLSDVGEEVFVLGYPLTSTMGDEIKLTTGVVSSKTGFQGNVSLYQISAPVQPGNSGGPLFDNKGNLIGVVSAKHKNAENVGYAIKNSYLKNLVESSVSGSILPRNNQISEMSLANKVKRVRDFIFIINCSNR